MASGVASDSISPRGFKSTHVVGYRVEVLWLLVWGLSLGFIGFMAQM